MSDLVSIDGSFGEGGGQILRTSLALSAITGRPIQIEKIRAGRQRPGLQPQHLKCVQATQEICEGKTHGAEIGSTFLRFEPGQVKPGDYQFDIGTAGATSLVLHTVCLPLALAGQTSMVRITGGTHVPHSPCFHYLEQQWARLLDAVGIRVGLKLDRLGFYPPGGGKIRAEIPSGAVRPLELLNRGSLIDFSGLSFVANLDPDIAERQRKQALRILGATRGIRPNMIETATYDAPSPGTAIVLTAELECGRGCYFALGERGKRAEKVAQEAAEAMRRFLSTDATVDEHAADQLLLPLAFASGPSAFRTPVVTEHLLTNAEIIRHFLEVQIEIEGEKDQPGTVRISPPHTSQSTGHR